MKTFEQKFSGAVNAQDIEGLGVSPAKGYGHVLGTDARFFGGGIIKLPKLIKDHPFKVYLRKTQAGGYEFKIRKGYVDGKKVTGTGDGSWDRLPSSNHCVVVEANISDLEIQEAKIKTEVVSQSGSMNWRITVASGRQTKGKIIVAQFENENNSVVVIQNIQSNLVAPLICYEGYAAKLLGPEPGCYN
jgi:hypothetical protein